MTGTEAKLRMSSRNSQIGVECVILTKFCIISSLPDRLIKRPTTLGNVGTRGGLRKDMMRYERYSDGSDGEGEVPI